jgi:hypothetical protein
MRDSWRGTILTAGSLSYSRPVNGFVEVTQLRTPDREEHRSRTATGALRAPEVVFVRGDTLELDAAGRQSRNDFASSIPLPGIAVASQKIAGNSRLRAEASTRPPPRWGINE